MKPNEAAANSLSTLERLDQVRMSPDERRTAKAYLRQAELLADILVRAHAEFHRVLGFFGRDFGTLASRGKVRAETPVRNEWSLP